MTGPTQLNLVDCSGIDNTASCEFSQATAGDMIWCVVIDKTNAPADDADYDAVNVFLGLNQYGE